LIRESFADAKVSVTFRPAETGRYSGLSYGMFGVNPQDKRVVHSCLAHT